jgi:hypothetical protein
MYDPLPPAKKHTIVLSSICLLALVFIIFYLYLDQTAQDSENISEINLSLPQINWDNYQNLIKNGAE